MDRFALLAFEKKSQSTEPAKVVPIASARIFEIARLFGGVLLEREEGNDSIVFGRWLRNQPETVAEIGRIISRDLDTTRFDWCLDKLPD